MEKFFVLWTNKKQNGEEYLAGNLGEMRVMVFKNGHKRNANDPDHIAYLAPKQPKQNGQTQQKSAQPPPPVQQAPYPEWANGAGEPPAWGG